jgi:hypothetical protein
MRRAKARTDHEERVSMVRKVAPFLALIFLTVGGFSDDFVNTFNTYYHDYVQLSQQGGQWALKVVNTATARVAEIKTLDIKNFYIQFVLEFNADVDSDGGPVEFTFATYPRAGKSDMVAESTWGRFDFLEPGSGEWNDITTDVLPIGVFRKFFDEKYLAQHRDDLPTEGHGMVNRQSEVEGPQLLHYLLTIPQIGTKTLLSVDGQTSNDYPQDANDLIAALKYHHMELSWDIKQGVFKIARIY